MKMNPEYNTITHVKNICEEVLERKKEYKSSVAGVCNHIGKEVCEVWICPGSSDYAEHGKSKKQLNYSDTRKQND